MKRILNILLPMSLVVLVAAFVAMIPSSQPKDEAVAGTTAEDKLYMYTIYERPRDYPQGYVVRRWEVTRESKVVNAGLVSQTPSLEEARKSLPPGLTNLNRDVKIGEGKGFIVIQMDDPCIVETWI